MPFVSKMFGMSMRQTSRLVFFRACRMAHFVGAIFDLAEVELVVCEGCRKLQLNIWLPKVVTRGHVELGQFRGF